jgi:hypothetical protein
MKKLAFDLIQTYKPTNVHLFFKSERIELYFDRMSNFKHAIQKEKIKNVTVEDDKTTVSYNAKIVKNGVEVEFTHFYLSDREAPQKIIIGVDELENS